jgi:putative ABC transport system permease protein
MPGILKIAVKSIRYYRKQALFQFLITVILCAVITGSLLTGYSVRSSLKKTASEHLGNTGILVSTGLRYFDRDLALKLRDSAEISCTGILEIRGSSQAMASQISQNNSIIYAVSDDFFGFHGDTIIIGQGQALVNRKLAEYLGIGDGDDIILRFNEITGIPADAPFAPEGSEAASMVLKVRLAGDINTENFSLSISQLAPFNIFINLADLDSFYGKRYPLNRLLIRNNSNLTADQAEELLTENLSISHSGLKARLASSGETEIISDRIFIDEPVIASVRERFPSAAPVITYLANRIEKGTLSNPYSFIAAIPRDIYNEAPERGNIIINDWLADDLNATRGDSIRLTWYSPDSLNQLVEKSRYFNVEKVVEMEGIWSDRNLMPDFPGIAGSESCSRWDAGVPINTSAIRQKDEDYWNDYKGTPKAFIDYETGMEIWGSNYGPATAIRFSEGVSPGEVNKVLAGSMDPRLLGFSVTGIREESLMAAANSVDFGTLFISLGFFLILAAFILLSFAVSYYFELKSTDISAFFALGFRNRQIRQILFTESLIISAAGCIAGAFAGYLVNSAIISALNSVWRGAVQTSALTPDLDILTLLTGFLVTFVAIIIFMILKTRSKLKKLSSEGRRHHEFSSPRLNIRLVGLSAFAVAVTFILSVLVPSFAVSMSFVSGMLLFLFLILAWRQYYLARAKTGSQHKNNSLSRHYYSFFPSHAITPVVFIAAGIFAVFITAVNRKDFNDAIDDRSSGTGGYKLWIETAVPVSEDLATLRGLSDYGFNEDSLKLKFVQMKRSPGNDASCLNLNHITAPPLLGADPEEFITAGAFSFAQKFPELKNANPWEILGRDGGTSVIYGIADQTVLDWGLKLAVGDTMIFRTENGMPLNIVIAAGLKSSVFQGFLIISKENFTKHFPSVAGHSVFLVECGDPVEDYKELLTGRFYNHGADVSMTSTRLEAFYEITNTYLTVFGVFGGFGMITGIAGLGFVLLRNYTHRRREFALLLATGFTHRMIRKIIFSEQLLIIIAGIVSGLVPAVVATLPSLKNNHEIPWLFLGSIVTAIFLTGILAVTVSLSTVKESSLVTALRKE